MTILAAWILEAIPPTPWRWCSRHLLSIVSSIDSITEIVRAFAFPKFSITPSTVVRMTSKSAGNSVATRAVILSLSPNFSSVNETSVVLVDDRHHSPREQRHECVARIQMPFVMLQVIVRQRAPGRHAARISRKAARTPPSGQIGPRPRRPGVQLTRPGRFSLPQRSHPAPTAPEVIRTFLSRLALLRHLGNELAHLGRVQLLAWVRQHAGAEVAPRFDSRFSTAQNA